MKSSEFLKDHFIEILNEARFAPSVHNSQPWKAHIEDNKIVVSIDKSNSLVDGDPTGRQTVISLGVFAEAIVISSESFGLKPIEVIYSKKTSSIIFADYLDKNRSNKNLVALLKLRTSDRSIYKIQELPDKAKQTLENAYSDTKVRIWVVDDRAIVSKIANLTSKGIGIALSSPKFRKELSKYLLQPWSKKKRGISLKSLYIPKFIALFEPILINTGMGRRAEMKLEEQRWLSSSGIVLITSKGDVPEYWFSAGRTYMRVSLEIERLGLSQATSAAIIEASSFHEDVETLLGTTQRLQCLIRIGFGSTKKIQSPRVDPHDLVSTLN